MVEVTNVHKLEQPLSLTSALNSLCNNAPKFIGATENTLQGDQQSLR